MARCEMTLVLEPVVLALFLRPLLSPLQERACFDISLFDVHHILPTSQVEAFGTLRAGSSANRASGIVDR